MFPPFLKRGIDATVDDCVEAIDYVSAIVGEDNVGIGLHARLRAALLRLAHHDKGRHRRLTDFGPIQNPAGIRSIGELPN